MSHNVSLKGISIQNFDALRAALEELNQEFKTKFTLKVGPNETTRLWNRNTVETGTVAVIKCPDFGYDIAIVRDAKGHQSFVTEALMMAPLLKRFGLTDKKLENVTTGEKLGLRDARYGANETLGMQASMGVITQRYTTILTEMTARSRGHQTSRRLGENGVMNVVITGA